MFKLILHKRVTKFLKNCNAADLNLVKTKLPLLKINPYNHPKLEIKKLKGEKDVYRLRIGKIRILYRIANRDLLVFVVSVGPRGNIYKRK